MGTKQKTTIAKVDWMDMIFDVFLKCISFCNSKIKIITIIA